MTPDQFKQDPDFKHWKKRPGPYMEWELEGVILSYVRTDDHDETTWHCSAYLGVTVMTCEGSTPHEAIAKMSLHLIRRSRDLLDLSIALTSGKKPS